jgi:biotin operon repressor
VRLSKTLFPADGPRDERDEVSLPQARGRGKSASRGTRKQPRAELALLLPSFDPEDLAARGTPSARTTDENDLRWIDALQPHLAFLVAVDSLFSSRSQTRGIPGISTRTDAKLLILVCSRDGLRTMNHLAALLDVDRTTVWRSVTRLKNAGLVTVWRTLQYSVPEITPKGRRAYVELVRRVVAQFPE